VVSPLVLIMDLNIYHYSPDPAFHVLMPFAENIR